MNNIQDKDIKKMNETDLFNYIRSQLYIQLDGHRKLSNSSSLYEDECAEGAIQDYFFDAESVNKDEQMNAIMIKVC
jgi:hypothetical protein